MIILKILLVLLGTAAVVLSFFLKDSDSDKNEAKVEEEKQRYVEHTLKMMQDKVKADFDEKTEDIIDKADAELSRMSNNKINEFNDFAQELLEKISVNNKEVIFLYDMLNEKDKEVKVTIGKLEDLKFEVNEMIKQLQAAADNAEKSIPEVSKLVNEAERIVKQPEGEKTKINEEEIGTQAAELEKMMETVKKPARKPRTKKESKESQTENTVILVKPATRKKTDKSSERVKKNKSILNEAIIEKKNDDDNEINSYVSITGDVIEFENDNDKILKLYEQGLSLVDISKKLDLGIGEIMLVLNIYKEAGESVWK